MKFQVLQYSIWWEEWVIIWTAGVYIHNSPLTSWALWTWSKTMEQYVIGTQVLWALVSTNATSTVAPELFEGLVKKNWGFVASNFRGDFISHFLLLSFFSTIYKNPKSRVPMGSQPLPNLDWTLTKFENNFRSVPPPGWAGQADIGWNGLYSNLVVLYRAFLLECFNIFNSCLWTDFQNSFF